MVNKNRWLKIKEFKKIKENIYRKWKDNSIVKKVIRIIIYLYKKIQNQKLDKLIPLSQLKEDHQHILID